MKLEQALKTIEPKAGDIEALTAAYLLNKEKANAEDAFNILWAAGESAVNNAIIKLGNGNSQEVERKEQEKDAKNLKHMEGIIEQIKSIEGIKAEICGKWLWVSGNTRPHANTLKSVGLKFARKKSKWYWRPEGYKRTRRGKTMSMEYIRGKYGSKEIDDN